MSKQGSRWYLIIVSILFALIILVAMNGIITYKTKVLRPQEYSAETKLASLPDKQNQKVAYYLISMNDSDEMNYVAVPRQVSVDTLGIQTLVLELLNFDDDKKLSLFSLIPENTKLHGLRVEGEILEVDFSEEFRFNSWGSQGYEGQLGQILRTLASVSPVRYVQIIIDGKKIDFLHEGIYIGLPIDLEPYRVR